jgi:hypothetical protein
MVIDIITCEQTDFVKHLDQNLKENEIKKILDTLNDAYLEISAKILKDNNTRLDYLTKIRSVQQLIKKSLGTVDIDATIIQDDIDEQELDNETKTKAGKRGRKKQTDKDLVEDLETELIDVPVIKSKSKNKKDSIQVAEDEQIIKKEKSTVSKTKTAKTQIVEDETEQKIKKGVKAKTVEPVDDELKVKKEKTSKVKTVVVEEPVEEPVVKSVKAKTSKTDTVKVDEEPKVKSAKTKTSKTDTVEVDEEPKVKSVKAKTSKAETINEVVEEPKSKAKAKKQK